jgi:peptide/nickel transport system substrate-binding protein
VKGTSILGLFILVVMIAMTACAAPATPTPAPAIPTTAAAAPVAATQAPAVATKPAAASTQAPSAPATTATPAVKVKRGGTLRFIMQNDVPTFDSHQCKGGNTPLQTVFDMLVYWKPNKDGIWGPAPGLASSWDIQGKEVTFKLQKGVKFHDGTDFNAKVAKWNLERAAFDKKSRLRSSLSTVDSVTVIDDYTVKVTLKAPDASFMTFLSDAPDTLAAMLSQAAMEKLGDDQFGLKPVGSGPMQFVEWMSGDRVVVKKFDGFWDKGADGQPLPYLDGIVYRIVVDDSVRYAEIRSGNAEFIAQIHPKDYASVKADANLVYFDAEWKPDTAIVTFNMESGPFAKSKPLRQAVAYALDRDAIVKTLGFGLGKAEKGQLLPGTIGYDPSIPYYNFDPTKAKKAVQDSGLPAPVEVHMMVHNRNVDMQAAQMYKQMMDQIGFNSILEVAERTANIAKREAGIFEFTFLQQSHSADPDEQFSLPYSCGSTGNFARYCNKDLDKCLIEGRSVYDPKQRTEIYKRCQQIINDDLPMVWIWSRPTNAVYSKSLKGYAGDWWARDMRAVWLDK